MIENVLIKDTMHKSNTNILRLWWLHQNNNSNIEQ